LNSFYLLLMDHTRTKPITCPEQSEFCPSGSESNATPLILLSLTVLHFVWLTMNHKTRETRTRGSRSSGKGKEPVLTNRSHYPLKRVCNNLAKNRRAQRKPSEHDIPKGESCVIFPQVEAVLAASSQSHDPAPREMSAIQPSHLSDGGRKGLRNVDHNVVAVDLEHRQ
jgi:hypothetical protein